MKEHPQTRKSTLQIGPDRARQILKEAIAGGHVNRRIRISWIHQLAARMSRGEWHFSEIHFDSRGLLVNGWHRLYAVIHSGTTQEFEVIRGLDRTNLYTMDDVKPRSLSDQIEMFEPTIANRDRRIAALRVCARLLLHDHSIIGNLEEYKLWYALFDRGLDWVVDFMAGKNGPTKNAGISGAIAFAYKAAPMKVREFAKALRDGENLREGNPALTFRRHCDIFFRRTSSSVERISMQHKLLTCIHADIHGQRMTRVSSSSEAVTFFTKEYEKELDELLKEVAVSKITSRERFMQNLLETKKEKETSDD